jgi:hypothetical protein
LRSDSETNIELRASTAANAAVAGEHQVARQTHDGSVAVEQHRVHRVRPRLAPHRNELHVSHEQVTQERRRRRAGQVDHRAEAVEEAGADRIDLGDRLGVGVGGEELLDDRGVKLVGVADQQPALRRRRGGRGRRAAHERATADAALKQPFGGEVGQRLAQRLGIHVEATRQRAFPGKLAGQFAALDCGAELFAQPLELVAERFRTTAGGGGCVCGRAAFG